MKKIIITISLFSSLLLNAEVLTDTDASSAIDVNIAEAVSANHKLIKILFEEKNKMSEELKAIKKELEELKKDKNIKESIKSLYGEKVIKKFVFSDGVNIRTQPNSNSQVVDILGAGEIIDCKTISNGWCKISENGFVWNKYLSSVNPADLLVTKDVFASRGVDKKVPTQLIERGTKVRAIGMVKDMYFLENGLVIDRKDAVK